MQLISILSLASGVAALSLPASSLVKRESPNQARAVANILAADGQTLELDESVVNSAAYEPFKASARVLAKSDAAQAARRAEQEPDPSRPATTPKYVFVLQCTENGFRGDCLVFGAAPGKCGKLTPFLLLTTRVRNSFLIFVSVSYFDFNSANSTDISDAYNDKVVSLSTNTGGNCQFYKYVAHSPLFAPQTFLALLTLVFSCC